eukprot:341170_1
MFYCIFNNIHQQWWLIYTNKYIWYEYGNTIQLNEIVMLDIDSYNKEKMVLRLGSTSGSTFPCFWDTTNKISNQETNIKTNKYTTQVSISPTNTPTINTVSPTTYIPSLQPSVNPTKIPTFSPTMDPTSNETLIHSKGFNTNLEIILFVVLIIVIIFLCFSMSYIYKLKRFDHYFVKMMKIE